MTPELRKALQDTITELEKLDHINLDWDQVALLEAYRDEPAEDSKEVPEAWREIAEATLRRAEKKIFTDWALQDCGTWWWVETQLERIFKELRNNE